jgi:hypothetical protein
MVPISWSTRRRRFFALAANLPESQSSRSELLPEYAILRLEIVDHLALVLVDPASKGNQEELERMRERRHPTQRIRRPTQRLSG